jgi:hypothetical protein
METALFIAMMLIKSKLVYELHRALAFERAGEKTEIGAVVFIDQIASSLSD